MGQALQDTSNAHEFLALFLAIHNISPEASAANDDLNFERYVSGKNLPTKNLLPRIKAFMDRVGKPGDYTRFEDLLIENRLAMIAGAKEHHTDTWGNPIETTNFAVGQTLAELPPRYWKAAIQQLLSPQSSDVPRWVDKIIPISSKGDYLRAIRNYLSLDLETVSAATGCQPNTIKRFESGRDIIGTPASQRVINYYAQQQKTAGGQFLFLDRDKLNSLNGGVTHEAVREYRNHRYRMRKNARDSSTTISPSH